MNKQNLVTLKVGKPYGKQTTEFYPNKFYRCETPEENKCENYLIQGEWFTQAEYDTLFETAHERMMRDWERFGLIKNGKPIGRTVFNRKVNTVKYEQRGTKPIYVFFFHNESDIYGFYPTFRDTKALSLVHAYDNYLRIFEGDVIPILNELIQFGNRGTPIAYGSLRSWW